MNRDVVGTSGCYSVSWFAMCGQDIGRPLSWPRAQSADVQIEAKMRMIVEKDQLLEVSAGPSSPSNVSVLLRDVRVQLVVPQEIS